jgi:hypothetical protein
MQIRYRIRPILKKRDLRQAFPYSLLFTVLLFFRGLPANAQTVQFLPEIDTYFKVNSYLQLSFQAKETREDGSPIQAELGPSVLFHSKLLPNLKRSKFFDLDKGEARKRIIVFSVGYRYLPSPYAPSINRLRTDFAFGFPMRLKVLLSDRNRFDLDWQSGKFFWRYRNRFQLTKRLTIKSYHPFTYVSVEAFYASQYQKWSTIALYAGCLFPIRKGLQLEPYYAHQNSTGKNPNQLLNQAGLILRIELENTGSD